MLHLLSTLFRSSSHWTRLPALFLLGLLAGVFFHYLLFRLGLPVNPFIYVAF